MPEFNHLDRCMIETEQTLWIAREALSLIEHSGAFAERIHEICKTIEALAAEMRDYNNQFEA